MTSESTIILPGHCIQVNSGKAVGCSGRNSTTALVTFLIILSGLIAFSVISISHLKTEIQFLERKTTELEERLEVNQRYFENLQEAITIQREKRETSNEDYPPLWEDDIEDEATVWLKNKREIREKDEASADKLSKTLVMNETEDKTSLERATTETSSLERSSEYSSKEKLFPTSNKGLVGHGRKTHYHMKHRKSRIGSAERFFTETHSTTSAPIQVRQSRTKPTQLQGIDKTLWLQSQKLQQHTSPLKDTITKEEAFRKGYGRNIEDLSYDWETSNERVSSDTPAYNMITIHFSADTSHYSRERDPHYFGNGRMQIKSEVYKDWKPAHWTQGVGMSKYFQLHQGRVTVSTTGIYLIYAQIQYSNVQEVNGFSVFRNKEVVVQCIKTSTHPDKHEIKSNTCGISTTILLQSNDSVCIKDLHHGRYVVLTPEKSYFGLVLLSPFKN